MTEIKGLETFTVDIDPAVSISTVPEETPAETPSEQSTAQELSEPATEETPSEEPTEDSKEVKQDLKEEPKKETKEPDQKQDAVQKRINKLTRKNYDTIREKDAIKRELDIAKAELSELRKAKEAEEEATLEAAINAAKPEMDDFASEADYFEAVGRWSSQQENAKFAKQQKTKVAPPQSQQDEQFKKLAPIQEKIIGAGRVAYEDFDEVALAQDKGIVITADMILAMSDDANAADVFYELSKNPAESVRISQLPPLSIARELGKISSKFDSTEDSVSNDLITKTTKASEPIKPIGSKTINSKDPTKMTNAEYQKYRSSQGVTLY